jgi:hypothetical protein
MRLSFVEDEEAAFFRARDELLDRFARTCDVDEGAVSDVQLALDWKWGYGDADLGCWHHHDLLDFLLEWCPRKVSMPPEEARSLPRSLSVFLGFLDGAGLLSQESPPLDGLEAVLARIGDEVVLAMADRSRYGMAKSLFSGMAEQGLILDVPDPEAFGDVMERFNALPYEVRGEILGVAQTPLSPWAQLTEGVELSPTTALPPEELTALAQATPLAERIQVICEFVGAGRKLTAKGNLTVADARSLGELLGDPALTRAAAHGWSVRSADDLPQLQFMLRWARATRAVRVAKGKVAVTASWAKLDPAAQVGREVSTILDGGPLGMKSADNRWAPRALIEVIDEGAVHLLVVLWAVADGLPFEVMLEAVIGACEMQLSFSAVLAEEHRHLQIRREVDDLFDVLALAGVVVRDGDERIESDSGIVRRSGGTLSLTPLGRAVLGPYLNSHGYPIPVVGELADRPMAALFDRIGNWPPDRTRAEFDHWVQCHSAAEAIDQMAVLLERYTDPQWPIAAIDLAGRLVSPEDERAVLRFYDTPARGHAIGWLIEHGHTDIEIDTTAMLRAGIEMMSMHADGADDNEFLDLVTEIDDLGSFIDEVWRVPIAGSAVVLEAIGRVHPDKAIAKAVRKATFKHRSFVANLS